MRGCDWVHLILKIQAKASNHPLILSLAQNPIPSNLTYLHLHPEMAQTEMAQKGVVEDKLTCGLGSPEAITCIQPCIRSIIDAAVEAFPPLTTIASKWSADLHFSRVDPDHGPTWAHVVL
jgi:hypothetical protein